jgi:glycosyltransferase involved in cell wall biosynthesis
VRITVITSSLSAQATIERTPRRMAGHDNPNVEHVVVDGGSADGTVELLSGADVRSVREPDRGLSDTMNKRVAMATGEAVGWLNADDFCLPGALATAAAACERAARAEWASGRGLIVDEHDAGIRGAVTAHKCALLRRDSRRSLLVQNFVAAPARLVRTGVLRELSRFDERFSYSMDNAVLLKLAERGDPAIVDEPLSAFGMAEGSLLLSGFERQLRSTG